MTEDWSAMCGASAPWQTANAFTLCRLPDGHDGDHERYGRTWSGEGDRPAEPPRNRAAARGEAD